MHSPNREPAYQRRWRERAAAKRESEQRAEAGQSEEREYKEAELRHGQCIRWTVVSVVVATLAVAIPLWQWRSEAPAREEQRDVQKSQLLESSLKALEEYGAERVVTPRLELAIRTLTKYGERAVLRGKSIFWQNAVFQCGDYEISASEQIILRNAKFDRARVLIVAPHVTIDEIDAAWSEIDVAGYASFTIRTVEPGAPNAGERPAVESPPNLITQTKVLGPSRIVGKTDHTLMRLFGEVGLGVSGRNTLVRLYTSSLAPLVDDVLLQNGKLSFTSGNYSRLSDMPPVLTEQANALVPEFQNQCRNGLCGPATSASRRPPPCPISSNGNKVEQWPNNQFEAGPRTENDPGGAMMCDE